VLSFLVSFLIWIFAGEPKRHIRDGQKVVEASREDPVANHDGTFGCFRIVRESTWRKFWGAETPARRVREPRQWAPLSPPAGRLQG